MKQFLSFEPSGVPQGFNGLPPLAGIDMIVSAKCGRGCDRNQVVTRKHFALSIAVAMSGAFLFQNG